MKELLQQPWHLMIPEAIIAGAILFILLLDLAFPRRRILISLLGLAAILSAMFALTFTIGSVGQIMNGAFRIDGFSHLFKFIALTGTGLVLMFSFPRLEEGLEEDRAEYTYLLLSALLGSMFIASSSDLLTLFVGLELLSISSYILVGLRRRSIEGNEAALKFIINGGIATATVLFGISYLFGLTGTTNLFEMVKALNQPGFMESYGKLVYLGFFFLFIGLTFKISAVPFHMWAPDVYQGASTPVTAFLSVVSTASGFAIILRIFYSPFAWVTSSETNGLNSFYAGIAFYLAFLAGITMIIGNSMALRQVNVKRMMAYSGIAQAGYLLIPLATSNPLMLDEMVFYLVAYLFMNLGAFAVIELVTRDRQTEELSAFAGLYQRSPFTAFAMTIFLLSLAGLPITAGFFGKLYIFLGALVTHQFLLAAIMLITSIFSYYYYFNIIRQMFLRPSETQVRLRNRPAITVVLVIGLLGTLIGGFFPGQVLGTIQQVFDSIHWFRMFD